MKFLIATTLIFNSTNPGRFDKFCKSSGQSTSKDTSVYYPLVMVFASTFPFTLSYLTRFCGSVYLKCFSAISLIVRFCHSLFLKRFCGYSCFGVLELSEASRSGWN
jgi:hypothetical protein